MHMRNSINIALALIRILGTVMIVLGLLFWTGNALALIPVHMLIGIMVVLLLWALAGLAARAGVPAQLVSLAFAWGIVVPALGVTQNQLLLGPAHWIIQVLHLLVGLVALALAHALAYQSLARVGFAQPRTMPQPAHGAD
jgi:hypothetical protein